MNLKIELMNPLIPFAVIPEKVFPEYLKIGGTTIFPTELEVEEIEKFPDYLNINAISVFPSELEIEVYELVGNFELEEDGGLSLEEDGGISLRE